ncbi:MAG: M28 family peptidase [Sphaerochaetaceae bacterium]
MKNIETLKAGKLAKLALALTATLITQFGPRPTGSEACLATAQSLHDSYEEFCDKAFIDEIPLHSEAFYLWIKILVILYPSLLLLLWIGLPCIATAVLAFFVFYLVREAVLFKPLKERWTKAKKGRNVWAAIEPKGEVKKTVIFSGHHDSAPLFKYNRLEKLPYYKKVLFPLLLCLLLAIECVLQLLTEILTGQLFSLGLPPTSLTIFLAFLSLGFPFVLGLWDFVSKEGSPGAGDNLVSSCMTIELSRYFDWKRRSQEALDHTRLVFVSFDGEESGLRGSRMWFREHRELLKGSLMLNFDCPYYADQIKFLDKDVNGSVQLSSRLAHQMVVLAQGMGYPAKSQSIPFFSGGTDAAEGARAGIESCTLTAVAWGDQRYPEVYHTAGDTVDAVEEKAIERAISLAVRFVELVDKDQLYEDEKPLMQEEDNEQQPQLHFKRLV